MTRPRGQDFFAVGALLVTASLSVAAPAPTLDPMLVRPQRSASAALPRPQQLASRRVATPQAGPFTPTAVPSLDGSPVEYLILTSDALAPAFERLAAWKTAKGVPAVVRTIAQVEATGVHGADRAETLRLYIRDAYLYWGVRWVLLGGDTEIIPPRYATAEFLGLKDPVTDLYYSCLDGDWNADGDAFFGEAYESAQNPGDDADLISEVFVGRAPASTLAEANLLVDKTLEYERPTVTDHQDRLLLMAEVLFPTDYQPGVPISIDGATFAENLFLNLVPTTTRVTRLYENYPAYPGSMPLTRATATSAINEGYETVVHIGHGYRYTLSAGDGSLDVGDAAAFNNGKRAGLMYMLNCTAAAYDFESFAEAMLLNPHGGATLVVGAAREAFPLAASDYQYAFFRHLYVLGQHRAGETLARSREEFVDTAHFSGVDRWTQLTYTLLGDPEVPLWTTVPAALQLQGMPGHIAVGTQALDLVVRDASGPLRGALVCLAKADEDYQVAHTDSLGHARLRFAARTAGTVNVTVSAVNYLPLESTVAATLAARTLVLADLGLVDDGAGSGAGNSDGRIDAGETVRLGLPLHNLGTATAMGVHVTLASTDADVSVVQGVSTYPDLAAGTEASALTALVVHVQPGAVDGRLASLTLTLSHEATTETHTVELLLHAARPRLVQLRVDDSRAGNGDGVQDAGEAVDLYYTIANGGTGTLMQGELQLTMLDAGLEVVTGSATIPALLPGTRGETTSPLTVREADLSAVHRGRLVLRHFQDSSGQSRRIDMRPPAAPSAPRFVATDAVDAVHIEWNAPLAVDLMGYDVYRITPTLQTERANADLVHPSYFRDGGLQPSTRYTYRIVALDSTLLQSAAGPERSVSTNPPQVAGWPLATSDRSSSSPAVADIDGDGQLDVAAASRQVFAWRGTGAELVDADENPLTWGLFYGTSEGFGSVTLADLDRQPGKEIVIATWDATARYVVAIRGDGTPLAGWPQSLVPVADGYRGAQVAPVVANLDAQGAPEILLAARDGRLYGWHADGSEIADGDANAATTGVLFDTHSPFLRCAPGVADLDPASPGCEIAIGATDGKLYVLDAHGVPRPGWPRSTWGASSSALGGAFTSGISIADIDRDGALEMVFVDGMGLLHAMRLDGSEPAGFPFTGVRAVSQSVTPSPAIGDLSGDSHLEIVIASSDGKLFVIDAAGNAVLPGGYIDIGAATESSPILGDVDGDAGIEIVLGDEQGVLNAWNLDGTPVDGFPITLRSEIRGTPALADADGDGNVDLAAVTWDGVVYLWNLGVPWRAERAPWPTYRGNVHRTGEFGYVVPTPVALQDLTAEVAAEGTVRLRWHGVATSPQDTPTWRVHRAGPYAVPPLGEPGDLTYTLPGESIGERQGTGDLEFVDRAARSGVWYAYAIGLVTPAAGGGTEETLVGRVSVRTTGVPAALRIAGNSPNPFNPQTSIRFEVPASATGSPSDVEMSLFDAHGRHVRTLIHARYGPGAYTVRWDGRDAAGREVASGIYVARLAASGRTVTRKLTLVR